MSDKKPKVVVIDDEPLLLESWGELLGERYDVALFSDPIAGQRYLAAEPIDVVLLDIRMPGVDGMQMLFELRDADPRLQVIMVSGHGTIEMAVQAMQVGAYNFLAKPVDDFDRALALIDGAVKRRRLRMTNERLQGDEEIGPALGELVGESRAIRDVVALISQIADATAPVLICGESGTGKELVARALHERSNRGKKPFLAVNCAATTETLIESELFGHERGAFTGANQAHKGLFESADAGVLFLDEIGDIPAQTQVRLLRAVQEGEIRPVGANKSRQVDVRVVAATNVDLARAISQHVFREDLYYRLSTFRIDLPPLRDRREDIPLIAQHLLYKFVQRTGQNVVGFSDDCLGALVAYAWPGNVRELNNAVEHAATLCCEALVSVDDLPTHVVGRGASRRRLGAGAGQAASGGTAVAYSEARTRVVREFEERYLSDLLSSTTGNVSEAARRSGIDRANLRRLLRRHSIHAGHFRDTSDALKG